jgi:GH24 family phage-related lysozyme (muramidase)
MTTVFEKCTETKARFEACMNDAAKSLKSVEGVGTGTMGLTPDHVKATASYKKAKAKFDWEFANLRAYNAWYVKEFKKELQQLRRA